MAELLISLAILGVIATFTIPKVLNSSTNKEKSAIAKEAAAMVSEAYKTYQIDNTISQNFLLMDLTPYLNYISVDTVSLIDHRNNAAFFDCSGTNRACYRLHNGAMLMFSTICFGGDLNIAAIPFSVDPDASYSGLTTGPGKSVEFFIYGNGRLTTVEHILATTVYASAPACTGLVNRTPVANADPEWFSWD